jgi:hypothetical protein
MAFTNSLATDLKFICDDHRANGGLHVAATRRDGLIYGGLQPVRALPATP